MRIITDIFEWCKKVQMEYDLSISGLSYTGKPAVPQYKSLSLSNGKTYVKAALEKGLDINVFRWRLSFFFNAHNNLFWRNWCKIQGMQKKNVGPYHEELGTTDEKAMMLRFHTYKQANTLLLPTQNNISPGFDTNIGSRYGRHTILPPTALTRNAEPSYWRCSTHCITHSRSFAFESGVADTADPLASSYFVESLTNEVEKTAWQLIEKIDAMGGSVASTIEEGFMHRMRYANCLPMPENNRRQQDHCWCK